MTPRPERTRPGSSSAVGRAPLTAAVETLTVGATPAPLPAPSQTPAVTESVSPVVTKSVTATNRGRDTSGEAVANDPRWTTFTRKEARFRADQLTDLAALRRRLNRSRTQATETITDNTLIRVAVDLLLRAHQDDLAGDTEAQLIASVLPREVDEGDHR